MYAVLEDLFLPFIYNYPVYYFRFFEILSALNAISGKPIRDAYIPLEKCVINKLVTRFCVIIACSKSIISSYPVLHLTKPLGSNLCQTVTEDCYVAQR